jgi:hypothetical protein
MRAVPGTQQWRTVTAGERCGADAGYFIGRATDARRSAAKLRL